MKAIVEKLKLTSFQQPVVLNRPNKNYLPELATAQKTLPQEPVDLIFAFVRTLQELQYLVSTIIDAGCLVENGLLYIAYPKKGNPMYPTFIHRNELFPALQVNKEDGYIAGTNYKFNRMAALDEVFTVVGIKHVIKKRNSKAASGRVDDYKNYIPEIIAFLQTTPWEADFFQQLTPDYQKEWARYIYSAKKAATRERRAAEMQAILAQGYRTKALYQRAKNEGII